MIRRALLRFGHDVLLADSPAEAITLADRYPVSLLVTDFMMPGMTGVELAGRVRDRHPAVPVILVSASPEAARLTIGSPSSFLARPFSMGELARAVASHTALPSSTP